MPESELENDKLFSPGVADDDKTPLADVNTHGKWDCPDDLPHVEIEEVSPPNKSRKVAHVTFGEVRVIHIAVGSPILIASKESLQPLHQEG